MTSALLYSGGLDAYCIDQLFHPDVRVFVDVGTEEAQREKEMLDLQDTSNLIDVDMQFLADFEKENKIVPFRNAFLIMAGAMYGDEVWLGATYGDGRDTVDTDPAFRSLAESLLNKFHEPEQAPDNVVPPYDVEYPAYNYTKGELVKEVVENGGSARKVASESKSCHYGDIDKGCGECLGCVRRLVALSYGALHDTGCRAEDMLTHFKADPREKFNDTEVITSMANRDREYEQFQQVADRFNVEVLEMV